jgi:putative DNA primase/helicase
MALGGDPSSPPKRENLGGGPSCNPILGPPRGGGQDSMGKNDQNGKLPQKPDGGVKVLLDRLDGVRPKGPDSWMARCPAHPDRNPSLSITLRDGRVLVHCFAGCHPDAVLEAVGLTWKDLRESGPWTWRPPSPSRPRPKPEPEREEPSPEDRKGWEDWWKTARPGHPFLTRYLRARGLSLESPPSLRLAFLRGEPVMVARVEGPGGLLGLHLTILEPDGLGRKEKRLARGSKPKGGAIRLFPLEEGQPLVLAEGIETALAVRVATGWPVWATIAAPFMKEVALPPEAKEVVIAADHDKAGIEAAHALARRLLREGRRVRIAVPPEEGEDWLDVLVRVKDGAVRGRPKEVDDVSLQG